MLLTSEALAGLLTASCTKLDLLDRQALQVGQRGIPGSEIVERDGDAEPAQGVKLGNHQLDVACQHAFGELEGQPFWQDAGFLQRIAHELLEVFMHKLADADIDGQRQMAQFGGLSPPCQRAE